MKFLVLASSILALSLFGQLPCIGSAAAAEQIQAKKKVGVVLSTQKELPKAAREVSAHLETDRFEVSTLDSKVDFNEPNGEAARILESSELDCLVVVGAAGNSRGKSLEILVFDARSPEPTSVVELSEKNEALLAKALKKDTRLLEVLGDVEGRKPVDETPTQPDVPPPPPPKEANAAEPEKSSTSPSGIPLLSVFVAAKAYSRSFVYTDSLNELFGNGFETLPNYSLPIGPMPHANIEVLPWAGAGNIFAGLGLVGDGEFGVLTSLAYRGKELAQTHYRFSAGLLYKLKIDSWFVRADGRYGRHHFSIDGDRTVSGEDAFPSVTYSMIEAGLALEYSGEKVRFGIRGAHLAMLGLGEIQSAAWFPNARGRGLVFEAFISRSLSTSWALRAGIDTRITGLDFNPISPSAPQSRIAGGGTDQYVGVTLGVEWRLLGGSETATERPKPTGGENFDSFE